MRKLLLLLPLTLLAQNPVPVDDETDRQPPDAPVAGQGGDVTFRREPPDGGPPDYEEPEQVVAYYSLHDDTVYMYDKAAGAWVAYHRDAHE